MDKINTKKNPEDSKKSAIADLWRQVNL